MLVVSHPRRHISARRCRLSHEFRTVWAALGRIGTRFTKRCAKVTLDPSYTDDSEPEPDIRKPPAPSGQRSQRPPPSKALPVLGDADTEETWIGEEHVGGERRVVGIQERAGDRGGVEHVLHISHGLP